MSDSLFHDIVATLSARYERPSCDEDCDSEICGSPRHEYQQFNANLGIWEDDT